MNSCYEYIDYRISNGLFDNFIDMVYILTLENSTRTNNYMNQIHKYKISSRITIQVNKGYKKCCKKLYQQNSVYDICDSYYNAFKHAKYNNYKTILIFEDDFFFDNINKSTIDEIELFITNNKYHVYNLGPTFHISLPYTILHHRSFFYMAAHAAIYSHLYIDYYIENYSKIKYSYDVIWNNINIIKYKYYKPLCYQLFIKTDNSQLWPGGELTYSIIKLLNMNKHHQPGFNICNYGTYLFYIIIIIIIIIIL